VASDFCPEPAAVSCYTIEAERYPQRQTVLASSVNDRLQKQDLFGSLPGKHTPRPLRNSKALFIKQDVKKFGSKMGMATAGLMFLQFAPFKYTVS
jgi:hypothetical protein